MNKLFGSILLIVFFGCSSNHDSLFLTDEERSKVDYMINLLEESGWKKDPNVSDEVRNRTLLDMGVDSVMIIADFMSKMSVGKEDSGVECEIVNTAVSSRADNFLNKHNGGYLYTVSLTGYKETSDSWYLLRMDIQYEYPSMYAVLSAGIETSFSSKWVSDRSCYCNPKRFSSRKAEAYVSGLLYVGGGYCEIQMRGWIEVNTGGIAIRGGLDSNI